MFIKSLIFILTIITSFESITGRRNTGGSRTGAVHRSGYNRHGNRLEYLMTPPQQQNYQRTTVPSAIQVCSCNQSLTYVTFNNIAQIVMYQSIIVRSASHIASFRRANCAVRSLKKHFSSLPASYTYSRFKFRSSCEIPCLWNIHHKINVDRRPFQGRAHLGTTPEQRSRNQWKAIFSQLQSLPNIITSTRILFTPYLSYLILTDQYTLALYGCALAGLSDVIDGFIAKNYGGETVLGTYLDPLADKILINSLALSLALSQHSPVTVTSDITGTLPSDHTILPMWCVLTWFTRDILLIFFSYRAAAIAAKGRDHNVADPSRTPLKVDPSSISKFNTLLQFATIGSGLGFGLDMIHITAVQGLCYASTTTTLLSGAHYFWTGKAVVSSGNRLNTDKDAKKR